MKTILLRTALFAAVSAPGLALAQSSGDAPVVVEVHGAAAHTVDATAVRTAIARELGVPVVASPPRASAPGGRLTIALDAARRLVVVYRDGAGREVIRATAMPNDPAAAVGIIALMAGNLARNEALEMLTTAPPAASPAAVVATTTPPTPAAAPPAAPRAVPAPVVGETATLSDRHAHTTAPTVASRHGGRLAIQLDAGAAATVVGLSAVYGLRVAYRAPARHLALGLEGTLNQPALDNLFAAYGTAVATLRGEWTAGVMRFDVGAGVGAMAYRSYDAERVDATGQPARYDLWTAAVRAGGGIALALGPWLDLTLRTDVIAPLWTQYASGGAWVVSPAFLGESFRYVQWTGTLGLQVRLL